MTETGRSSRLSPAQQADALRDEAKHDVAPALTPDVQALAERLVKHDPLDPLVMGQITHMKAGPLILTLARAYLAAEQRATEAGQRLTILRIAIDDVLGHEGHPDDTRVSKLRAAWLVAESDRAALRARVEALEGAMRALVEAVERGRSALGPYAFAETDEAWAAIRALVLHVGQAGEEGR